MNQDGECEDMRTKRVNVRASEREPRGGVWAHSKQEDDSSVCEHARTKRVSVSTRTRGVSQEVSESTRAKRVCVSTRETRV